MTSFFPDGWDRDKILKEVQHAIENNEGYADPKALSDWIVWKSKSSPHFYIRIQYNPEDWKISSFYPIFDNNLK